MKKLFLLLLLSVGLMPTAKADLLERFRLEEALKSRLQDTFKMYDETAQIVVHLDYASFDGALPGTAINSGEKIAPDKIELNDISKVQILVYSSLEKLPDHAKEGFEKAIPVEDKNKISISFVKIDPNSFSKPIIVKDLNAIAEKTVSDFTKIFLIFMVCTVAFITMISLYLNSKRMKEFKTHFNSLVSAITEGAGNQAPMMINAPSQNNQSQNQQQMPGQINLAKSNFDKISFSALKAVFSDAYWCEADGYAHWLWKNLEGTQKTELLTELAFMKDYSLAFADVTPMQGSFHDHPYYLDPIDMSEVSQKDLSQMVKKDMSLWHMISPMRKLSLSLTLDEKLRAVSAVPKAGKIQSITKVQSPSRALVAKPSWGDITSDDEVALFNNPEMVPPALRQHIRSLVWLAQKDKAYIEKILSQYDARELASAWIGPEEILKALEANMPEKKRSLLQTYKEKVFASRTSEIYQLLVAEGLKNEAA